MIEFIPRRTNKEDNRTPVMFDREIDEYAHAILADYNPELLEEPGKIDMEHFLEQYLEADIQFHDIYNDDPDRPILALTAFTEGNVDVFDYDNECISSIYVSERTVIIDNAVMEPGKEGLALFSCLHEGGHLVFHWNVYVNENRAAYKQGTAAAIACRRNNIECSGFARNERSPADWREHQADYFAAALAMPNATFYPLVNQFMRENGVFKGSIKLGQDSDLDILANYLMPEYISETYGVSKRAARIKLRKNNFVT